MNQIMSMYNIKKYSKVVRTKTSYEENPVSISVQTQILQEKSTASYFLQPFS